MHVHHLDCYSGSRNYDEERRQEFGRQMVALRKRLCLSVEEMAERLSISIEALQRIENGLVCPDLDQYASNLKKRIEYVAKRQVIVIA
jgi:DNA-binding XRE family transcriptional regulator